MESGTRFGFSLEAGSGAYPCLLTVVFFGSLRMRTPVEPLVVLYAAAGIHDVLRRLRRAPADPGS